MKKTIFTAIVLSSQFALSAIGTVKAFDMEMNLSIDGKAVSTPRIIAKEGEKEIYIHEANGERNSIEVLAKEVKTQDGVQAIEMIFTVSRIAEDGSSKVIAQPHITALPNSQAMIQVGENVRPNMLSLKVVANNVTF